MDIKESILHSIKESEAREKKIDELARQNRGILTVRGLIEQLENGFNDDTPVVGSINQSHRIYGNVSVDSETEDKEDSDDIRHGREYCVISVGASAYSPSQVVGESVDEKSGSLTWQVVHLMDKDGKLIKAMNIREFLDLIHPDLMPYHLLTANPHKLLQYVKKTYPNAVSWKIPAEVMWDEQEPEEAAIPGIKTESVKKV